MRKVFWPLTIALNGLVGCAAKPAVESDEHKLTRLRTEVAMACQPFAAAESALSVKYPMVGREETPIAGMTLAELQEHVAKLKREQARDSAIMKHMAQHPGEMQSEIAALGKLLTKCDLAKRSLNLFMNGQ